MRRATLPNHAMFGLQSVIRTANYDLALRRTGRFWELWFVGTGEDLTDEQIRDEEERGGYVTHSSKIGDIKIDPKGSIRSLDFGARYENRSVLHQLMTFLDNAPEMGQWSNVDSITADLRPNGSMIDVDVVALEVEWYDDEEEAKVYRRVVARFAYDPAANLLIFRAKQ